MEPLGAIFRASGGGLRPAVGASWGVVGGVLGASAVVLERPWAAQGGVSNMFILLRESADFANPERVPKRSQRRLGAVLEALYLSGESWVGLGGVAGRLETALLASWATLLRQQWVLEVVSWLAGRRFLGRHGVPKSTSWLARQRFRNKTGVLEWRFESVLRACWWYPGASWDRFECVRGRSCSRRGGVLGRLEGVLRASWRRPRAVSAGLVLRRLGDVWGAVGASSWVG